jgi:hypothetical protein
MVEEPQLQIHGTQTSFFVKMQNEVDYRKNKSISFLWNVMDRKTLFLSASKLSPFRDRLGAMAAFRKTQKNTHENFPERIFTDSLLSYVRAPYMNTKGWNVKHIKNCEVNKGHDKTNDRIERMNGTFRERVKVENLVSK